MSIAKKVKQKRHESEAAASKAPVSRPAPRKHAKRAQEVPAAPAPPVKKPVAGKPAGKKPVRDTFRMPQAEFDGLRKLKARAKSLGVPAKKSEILRAGLRTLMRMDDEHFAVLLAQVQNP